MSWRERWTRLWQRPRSRWLIGIPIGGFLAVVVGAMLWEGMHFSLRATNTMEFCVSCHEMNEFVFEEYKETPHYQNASGVRAGCPDCHVPKALVPKVARKIQAALNEVPGHFFGVIDTREKFEAHRPEMAKNVWSGMKENNSRECRSCHSYEAMSAQMQGRSASKKHSVEWRERFGDTCIDCHYGIAHKMPEGLTPADLEE